MNSVHLGFLSLILVLQNAIQLNTAKHFHLKTDRSYLLAGILSPYGEVVKSTVLAIRKLTIIIRRWILMVFLALKPKIVFWANKLFNFPPPRFFFFFFLLAHQSQIVSPDNSGNARNRAIVIRCDKTHLSPLCLAH